ncbi:RHS repeat-associated core domain-containing protein [[Empedobacter] haloabium]|uniref:RHS repeat-associated core domain-containing protein n=1 Tax=[Empedobacter] haloabium TaxID=592317 RepID=A0ABZ1UU84_9BURK
MLTQTVTASATGPVIATNIYYIYSDHLGAPRWITQATDNAVRWRWDHADPFGLQPLNDNPAGLGMLAFNLRLPGQYDRESNLHYNYFRDYDPQTGRYVQSDPIGLDGGINTCGYALGNPVSYTDPKGLFVPALIIAGRVAWTGYRAYRTYQAANAMASAIKAANAGASTGALNGCPPNPGNKDPCKGKRDQLAAHEQKYRDYMENPHAHDNNGWLSAAYESGNMTRYTNILNGRYKELNKQIDNFRKQLEECEATYGKR